MSKHTNAQAIIASYDTRQEASRRLLIKLWSNSNLQADRKEELVLDNHW